MGRLRAGVGACLLVGGLAAAPGVANAAGQADRDAQEVSAYRLSMEVLKKVADVSKAVAAAQAKDPRRQELAKKKAELAALEEKEEPTEAELARMETLGEEIERLEQGADEEPDSDDAESLSEMARRMEAMPAAVAALRSSGLTAREYATVQLALLQAGLAYSLMKSTGQTPEGISKHNLDFVREHEKEIAALGTAWKRSTGDR